MHRELFIFFIFMNWCCCAMDFGKDDVYASDGALPKRSIADIRKSRSESRRTSRNLTPADLDCRLSKSYEQLGVPERSPSRLRRKSMDPQSIFATIIAPKLDEFYRDNIHIDQEQAIKHKTALNAFDSTKVEEREKYIIDHIVKDICGDVASLVAQEYAGLADSVQKTFLDQALDVLRKKAVTDIFTKSL